MSSSPQPQRSPLHESFFGLFGGPLAWYAQLNAGFALASQPCFRDGIRLAAPIPSLQWSMHAMVLTTLGALVVAVLALRVSWRALGPAKLEGTAEAGHSIDASSGRMRFLALWGVLLGASFALATAITGAIFIALPRCAG